MIAEHLAPSDLWDKKIVVIDTPKVLAEANEYGGINGLMTRLANEAAGSGNMILFIPDTDALTGGEGIANLSSILGELLGRPGFQFIGTPTPQRFAESIETNPSLSTLIDKVEVNPLDFDRAVIEIGRQANDIENGSGVLITYQAIRKAMPRPET